MIPLRRLTDEGISTFEELLDRIRQGDDPDLAELRDDDSHTERIDGCVVDECRRFTSRRDAAEYLYQVLGPLEGSLDVERDRGLWAWLSLVWLDVLAPKDPHGLRALGELARWIPVVDSYRKYYRHLLAGPYRIYRAHRLNPDRAMGLLATSIDQPGDVVEQFASRQDIVSSSNVMQLITTMYYDPAAGRMRRGAARKVRGGARRLAAVLLQLDLTWDVHDMAVQEIMQLLPGEFDEFRSPSSASASSAAPVAV